MADFKHFLAKAGAIAAGIALQAPVIEGIFSSFIPQAKRGQVARIEATVNNDLSVFAGIVVQVQAIGGIMALTGEQKFAAARPLVRTAMLGTVLVSAHKIADNDAARAAFENAVDSQTQAIVFLLQSFDESGVQTQGYSA